MKKNLSLAVFIVLSASMMNAQDINFSQFYELPLLRNPALAGLFKGDLRVTGDMRNQWASVTVPFQTQDIGAEFKFPVSENSDNYWALGLQITNDLAGDSKLGKTQVLPVLAFHKSLSADKDTYLSLGVYGGPVEQRFDPTRLKFDDQFVNGAYSPTNPTRQSFSNTSITYWDASVGLLFSSTLGNEIKYYCGVSYFHFNNPKVAFSSANDIRLNNKTVFSAGVSAPASDFDKVIFYADYFRQGGNAQTQAGIMFSHDLSQDPDDDESLSLTGGMLLRWDDAVIPIIKMDYYKLAIGLSYDVNISKLRSASQTRGAYELTLSYRSFLNIRNTSLNKLRCPKGL
jgi:type IX secretion system PorP/SprF family membrane protein